MGGHFPVECCMFWFWSIRWPLPLQVETSYERLHHICTLSYLVYFLYFVIASFGFIMLHVQSLVLLLLVLSESLVTLAAPSPQPPNAEVFAIQPNDGGGLEDDCGEGPISLNAATWNQYGMDDLIGNMFRTGNQNPNFDFHQEFGSRYGVDFRCPNSFANCQTVPQSCSSLTAASPKEKAQGWLGMKAMMNVQELFQQWEKVTDSAMYGLTQNIVDLKNVSYPCCCCCC